MFHVALYQPEIPPNTGNIIRLCANTGAQLHLIYPIGFAPNDKQLQRAGLDYHAWTEINHHKDYQAFLNHIGSARIFACSTHGQYSYHSADYVSGDVFLFGPETRGLPSDLLQSLPVEQVIRIPMLSHSRSLNLSNAVAVMVYEAWRQQGFSGMSR